MSELRSKNPLQEPHRTAMNADIDALFNYGRELDKSSHEIYLLLMDFHAEIMAALVESEKYLPVHVYRQLNATISNLFSQEQNNKIQIKGIKTRDLSDLMEYLKDQYSKDLLGVILQLGKDETTFLKQVREVFTI